jgi:hypothetical protein
VLEGALARDGLFDCRCLALSITSGYGHLTARSGPNILKAVATHWKVESRLYYCEKWEDGVAQLVRGEHQTEQGSRIVEAVFWWPAREGKEWPATVITIDSESDSTDLWAHFEQRLGMDDRYRWEQLPPD